MFIPLLHYAKHAIKLINLLLTVKVVLQVPLSNVWHIQHFNYVQLAIQDIHLLEIKNHVILKLLIVWHIYLIQFVLDAKILSNQRLTILNVMLELWRVVKYIQKLEYVQLVQLVIHLIQLKIHALQILLTARLMQQIQHVQPVKLIIG